MVDFNPTWGREVLKKKKKKKSHNASVSSNVEILQVVSCLNQRFLWGLSCRHFVFPHGDSGFCPEALNERIII